MPQWYQKQNHRKKNPYPSDSKYDILVINTQMIFFMIPTQHWTYTLHLKPKIGVPKLSIYIWNQLVGIKNTLDNRCWEVKPLDLTSIIDLITSTQYVLVVLGWLSYNERAWRQQSVSGLASCNLAQTSSSNHCMAGPTTRNGSKTKSLLLRPSFIKVRGCYLVPFSCSSTYTM